MSEASPPEPRDQVDQAAAGAEAARPTLAARLAERSRQRALRAERLARLRPPARAEADLETGPVDDEAEAALREFLRALTGDMPPPAAPVALTAAAEVLSFQRPERAETGRACPVSDLESLPGVGPNLVWALEQAGIGCLADLVPLAPADLVNRLGPIGRLVPAAGWIATARAAVLPV